MSGGRESGVARTPDIKRHASEVFISDETMIDMLGTIIAQSRQEIIYMNDAVTSTMQWEEDDFAALVCHGAEVCESAADYHRQSNELNC